MGDWLTQVRCTANGGFTPPPLGCFPQCKVQTSVDYWATLPCKFSFFSHYQYNNGTIKQYHNINTPYIHYLSHITTLYLIALLHYSHSHPTSLTADPHGPRNSGATMVVLYKRFCTISLPVWPGNLNLPPLMCDSQYAQNPRHTYSIQPINQVTSCSIPHT